ncbi:MULTISPECIES: tyrosine-type recombinase/integrase [Agrobacterium]|uniref:Tyrosine-type recombinase/integrase n=1 Tax=Agrobacterium pusense TaxID=648995 RepID=A0AA44ENI7_9HYPH|nr:MULTISPECIES: site-specific integrase [Agrobacterium]NRF11296.1 tyrosine-type recombinase/integrase [Agrobacterium pusense]NRF22006.1 tyrosine-type recombinase/integrase [Agrobacterium pusense]CDN95788.1 Tyrosine site-specific integrase/recombinase protein [Agrobacterium tumefaciens]
MAKITKRSVDAAAPTDKEFFLWDDELKGFGLRVYPSGRKMYLAQFRSGGRLRRVNIGLHGAVTPDLARTEAMKHLSQVRLGADPAGERDRRKASPSIKEFGQRFLDEHVASHCKPSTQAEYKRSVELFINPKLGSHRIIDITRADVVELHQSLKDTPYQANRTLGVLSVMFTVAHTWGVRTDGVNPCWKVKRYKEVKRERYLTPDELARLGKVLRESNSEREAASCIQLLLLTGCRLSEIQKLKWEHVDLGAGLLRLPDSKSGAKLVAVGQAAVDVFKTIPKLKNNPYVITGTIEGQHLTDMQKPWRRLRKRAGLDDLRIHDLRHSFASDALQLGEDLTMIGRLLGHTQVQTTARYAHLKTDPIRAAANKVSDAIALALTLPVKENDAGENNLDVAA